MKKTLIIFLFLILFLVGCAGSGSTDKVSSYSDLSLIKTWTYQIQDQNLNNNIQKLADSQYELLVINN